jgi:hypothetical protein
MGEQSALNSLLLQSPSYFFQLIQTNYYLHSFSSIKTHPLIGIKEGSFIQRLWNVVLLRVELIEVVGTLLIIIIIINYTIPIILK